MKRRFLFPSLFKILLFGSIVIWAENSISQDAVVEPAAESPAAEQPAPEKIPASEEPASEAPEKKEGTADQPVMEKSAPETPSEKTDAPGEETTPVPEEPEPVVDERIEALKKIVTTEVANSSLSQGKRTQLRSMVLAAYRDNQMEPLWPARQPGEEDIFEAYRSFLILHGFEAPMMSFSLREPEESLVSPLPLDDILVTIGLSELCLRLKQGPESVSEWPNWNISDQPIDGTTNDHYDEITARFGKTAAASQAPLEVAAEFVPKNWIYQRIFDEIQRDQDYPEPPKIVIDGLIKVGNDFPQAAELAAFLHQQGHLPEEQLEEIDTVYTEPLSEAVRSFQKEKGLKSDGILGPSTTGRIFKNDVNEKENLYYSLHCARRLPDNPGEKYLIANLPSGEVYGIENGEETIRMRIVFGKHTAGQHTPIFRDKMEQVVFRPYWNVPYSIAVGESNYSNLDYLSSRGFEIISESSGSSLPLTSSSLSRVATRSAYVRQEAGGSNALGVVKFLFPNKHAVYFHDTPSKQYFKRDYRAQSHGCVRLQNPEGMANWVLKDYDQWNPDKINYAMYKGKRNQVDLEEPIPVYIVYFTAFPDPKKEQGVDFYRDVYNYDRPGAVIDAPGPKPVPRFTVTEEKKKRPLLDFLRSNKNSGRPSSSRPSRGGNLFQKLRARQN